MIVAFRLFFIAFFLLLPYFHTSNCLYKGVTRCPRATDLCVMRYAQAELFKPQEPYLFNYH